MSGIIRFGAIAATALKPFTINIYDGTIRYAYFVNEIRVIAEALNLPFDVLLVPDGTLGYRHTDGNWSGSLGMLERAEIDIAMYPMQLGKPVPENAQFSYPYGISDTTFMTNKPEPVSKSLAIVHPFPYSMWIALAVILIVVPILFYILMNGKVKYQTILFDAYGNLLEQSFSFDVERSSTRMILTGWLLGVMIISYGYKAVLLSSLSVPRTTIIRDIPDLGRAAAQGSVTCFTSPGSDLSFYTDSDIESWRDIGACLQRNEGRYSMSQDFYRFASKKILISSRRGLSYDEKNFYISEDSFSFSLYGFLLSKEFSCSEKFNSLINLLRESGLDKKFEEEEKFFWQYFVKDFSTEDSAPSTPSRKILLTDISGVFFVLVSGWVLAFLTLVGEIIKDKFITPRK